MLPPLPRLPGWYSTGETPLPDEFDRLCKLPDSRDKAVSARTGKGQPEVIARRLSGKAAASRRDNEALPGRVEGQGASLTSFQAWFREKSASTFLRGYLICDGLVTGLFGRDLTERPIVQHIEGRSDHSRLLWALLFLEV